MAAGTARTFRIFISSTFSDLKGERNALQRVVFPRLRDLCRRHGCRIQPIDLRWGVREEAALDQQTMRICLEEIAHSQKVSPKPNFIVLLGDRYGWQPLPAAIPAAEFEALLSFLPMPEDHEILSRWYHRDDNAVPPEFRLLPRSGDYADPGKWEGLEKRLIALLRRAARQVPLAPPDRTKYETSATEQEILAGALQVPDASDHVFCYFRKVNGLPPDGTAKDIVDLDQRGNADLETRGKLENLKSRLRTLLPGHVADFEASWTGNGITTGHIDDLCQKVTADLESVILGEIRRLETIDPVTREKDDHESFGRERARDFVGREESLDRISAYLAGDSNRPFVLAGASGSGKTALMGRAADEARRLVPGAVTIIRCIGATPGSSDGRALLESLGRQIARSCGGNEASVPSEFKALAEDFPRRLALATKDRPILLFLDALDQLSPAHAARALGWLPAELPFHAKIVVSATPGDCLVALRGMIPDPCFLSLEPMSPAEGKELLGAWLRFAGRTLQPAQAEEIARKFDRCGLPLYLKTVFEEARRWNSDTPVPDLGADVPGIIRGLFSRLSSEAQHGPVLVSRSLGYLAAAKNGLSEDELLDVLSLDPDVLADFELRAKHAPPEKKLPVVVWSRLFFDLETYLAERNADGASLLSFYHRQFGEAAGAIFLGDTDRRKRHASLAEYFAGQPLVSRGEEAEAPNLRKLSELPYQQTRGELRDELSETLTDPAFLEAKCAHAGLTADESPAGGQLVHTGIYELLEDYRRALESFPGPNEPMALIREALRLSSHHLRREPGLLGPQLIGRLTGFGHPEIRAFLGRFKPEPGRDLLRALTPALIAPGSNIDAILGRSTSDLSGLWISDRGDTAVSFSNYDPSLKVWDIAAGSIRHSLEAGKSGITSVAVTPDCRVAAVNCGREIVVWDLVNGRALARAVLSEYCKLAITPDGRTVMIWSPDGRSLFTWDHCGISEPRSRHKTGIYADSIAVSPDGRFVFVTNRSYEKTGPFWKKTHRDVYTTELWDLEGGRRTAIRSTTPLAMAPEGHVWSLGAERNIEVRAVDGGRIIASLAHRKPVTAVHMTPNGARALTLSGKGTASVWDLGARRKLFALSRGKRQAACAALRSDGEMAAVAYDDREILLWDLGNRKVVHRLKGHGSEIESLQFLFGGGRLVSEDRDEVVIVFDTASGAEVSRLRGAGPAPTPDGSRIVTAFEHKTLLVWKPRPDAGSTRPAEHRLGVNQVLYDTGGPLYISASNDGTIRAWDPRTREEVLQWAGHKDKVKKLLITPDGRYLVSASWDKTVRSWDLHRRRPGPVFDGGEPLLLSPRGPRAIFLAPDAVEERDLAQGRLVRRIRMDRREAVVMAISPGGERLITGDFDGQLRVYDHEKGVLVHTLRGHTRQVRAVLFTPDGSRAVSISMDRTLRLWDLSTGRNMFTRVAPSLLERAVLVPGKPLVISGAYDGSLAVWDLAGMERLRTLGAHFGSITDISVTPDGASAVSTAEDGGIRVWDIGKGSCAAAYYADVAVNGCAIDPSGRRL
ncbi:MAG TPA: AAA family ATPase, partial [Acidobacteriota bacterium]|nr:AAA family ATPase [Acidobacteriota bacterium]